MYRVDNSTAATTLPTPGAVGPNPNGYFTSGNPASGIAATVVDADWMNSIQETVANPIEASGETLSKTDETQLTTAIKTLPPGRLLRTTIFTNVGGVLYAAADGGAPAPYGASTFTPLSATASAEVEVQAAGGAGGGVPATTSGQSAMGGGGGGGGYAFDILTAAQLAGAAIAVGAGGVGASGVTTGGAGGLSKFGTLQADGGAGGYGGTNGVTVVYGGVGGTVPNPGAMFPGIQGGPGGISQNNAAVPLYFSGVGANSKFGFGGSAVAGSSAGLAGTGYGSGSSGSGSAGSGAAVAAANGQPGIIIVRERS